MGEAPDDSATGEGRVSGTIARVVFHNAESGFTVARLHTEDGAEIAIVGSAPGIAEGTPVTLSGRWVMDRRYGRQFRFETYQLRSPETLLGIERYLGSGLVPGIGPELAKRITARFGTDTFEVIGRQPERLVEVEGIGPARAKTIAEAWSDQREYQDVMVFLRGHGIPPAQADKIFKRYGTRAIELVRANPYRLALEIHGIGFRTADAIAKNLGLAVTAPERLEAGLVHVLGALADDGHVHVPHAELVERSAAILEVEANLLPPALNRLERANLVVSEILGDRGPCISLTELWQAEHDAAAAFAALCAAPLPPLDVDLDHAIAGAEVAMGVQLAPQQRQAVQAALLDKATVITGGPGVGKTTIVRAIVDIMARKRRRVRLAAPTGRAAMRLSESTGADASTVHRLLEFQPHEGRFARDADNPLEADAVIVDEVSMVDIGLFRSLMVAMPPAAQLILVGDIDQLPSVGPGSVLADIIASGAAAVVRLTEIFRQAAESRIVVNAHRINEGLAPELDAPAGGELSDFYFIERDDPLAARQTVVDLVAERIPERFGFDRVLDVQVLAPMHRGELGTITLNQVLQDRLNPAPAGARQLERGQRTFRAGDKVMQVRNDYDRSVFNGDIGVVRAITEERRLLVEFADGRAAMYERGDLDQLTHAYAVSIHKSQGSEYPAIVLPLSTQHYMMLQRNLLYTGITRGKKLVVVVGSRRALAMAVRNNATASRWTWLAERIRAAQFSAG